MSTEMPEKNPPIIAFTAGKGGCGKTTLSVNFAYNIFKAGKKVLLIDFDLSNRGASGVFAHIINKNTEQMSGALTDLLDSEKSHFDPKAVNLVKIKKGYYFLPASHIGSDIKSEIYEKLPLTDIIANIKQKLFQIASANNIDCIILDCFCGIDILTTTAVCMSSDAVFINEADIITFTGTIYLHRHIQEQLKTLPDSFERPKIHLIINRLKSEFTVAELNVIYKDNLLVEFPNGAECHFLYNERIFKNFGKYPFWEDLMPNSMFIKKMNLLCWQIFKGYDDTFLRNNVKNWSEKKAAALYLRSKDYNAIDLETLVMQFTNLIMYSCILLSSLYIGTILITLGPFATKWFLFLMGLFAIVIYITNLITPVVLLTKLNFTIATFKFRLQKHTDKLNTINSAQIFFQYLKGVAMAICVGVLISALFYFVVISMGESIGDYFHDLIKLES